MYNIIQLQDPVENVNKFQKPSVNFYVKLKPLGANEGGGFKSACRCFIHYPIRHWQRVVKIILRMLLWRCRLGQRNSGDYGNSAQTILSFILQTKGLICRRKNKCWYLRALVQLLHPWVKRTGKRNKNMDQPWRRDSNICRVQNHSFRRGKKTCLAYASQTPRHSACPRVRLNQSIREYPSPLPPPPPEHAWDKMTM